jgi:hypothetical protein
MHVAIICPPVCQASWIHVEVQCATAGCCEVGARQTNFFFFFVIHVYSQSVQVHLANEVIKRLVEECPAAHLHYI